MSERAVHVLIEGRVQGVWFRGWTAREADALNITGWVRNLRDGKVEAVFAGSADAVDEILRRCHDGPPASRVAEVKVTDADDPGMTGFETRSTA